jgi:hypothetical protein
MLDKELLLKHLNEKLQESKNTINGLEDIIYTESCKHFNRGKIELLEDLIYDLEHNEFEVK